MSSIDLCIRRHLVAPGRRFDLEVALQTTQRRVVIFGESGAGKSLTLKAIAGLLRPDSGWIRVDGTALFDAGRGIDLSPQVRRLGYVFQDYALFPHLTVRQNIAFPLATGLFNPRAAARMPAVEQWLELLQLGHMADQYPRDISGGQRQRTAVARALVAQPRALLLDEPFAALDHASRQATRRGLEQLLDTLGIPVVLITHDPADVELFGGAVLHLRDGRNLAPDPP
jgi:molybdate transport system ATP-binding protein